MTYTASIIKKKKHEFEIMSLSSFYIPTFYKNFV